MSTTSTNAIASVSMTSLSESLIASAWSSSSAIEPTSYRVNLRLRIWFALTFKAPFSISLHSGVKVDYLSKLNYARNK